VDFISPGVLRRDRLFLSDTAISRGNSFTAAHRRGENGFSIPRLPQFSAFLLVVGSAILVAAENDSFSFRNRITRWATYVDGAAVLLVRTRFTDRFVWRLKTAGRRAGAGPIRLHLPIMSRTRPMPSAHL